MKVVLKELTESIRRTGNQGKIAFAAFQHSEAK